jgi:hypothetical protein
MPRAIWTGTVGFQRKVKAGEINTLPAAGKKKRRAPAGPKLLDLSELLAQSVAQTKKGPAKARAPERTRGNQRKSA